MQLMRPLYAIVNPLFNNKVSAFTITNITLLSNPYLKAIVRIITHYCTSHAMLRILIKNTNDLKEFLFKICSYLESFFVFFL